MKRWDDSVSWVESVLKVCSAPQLPLCPFVLEMGGRGGSLVAQSFLTLCDPMNCSPPGPSVHGILQATILEWVVISFSWESSQPRDWTCVSCITGRFLSSGKEGTSHENLLACFRESPGSLLHLPFLTSLWLEILSLPKRHIWGGTCWTPSVTCTMQWSESFSFLNNSAECLKTVEKCL